MLDLLKTFAGSPAGALHHLVLPHVTLIVRIYPAHFDIDYDRLSSCTLPQTRS